jgi:carboxymethylenebutenolidase
VRSGMVDMESNTTLVQCYPAHEAIPDGAGPFPAVVVAHDRFGLNPHSKGIASRLAASGFYALAPNFYARPTSVAAVAPEYLWPASATSFGFDQGDRAADAGAMLPDDRAEAIFRQAINYAVTRGHVRAGGVGLLGFSMGARLAFLAACRNPDQVRAGVCFYPGEIAASPRATPGTLAPLDWARDLAAPLLLFYGQLDTTVSRQERETIRERLAALDKDFRIEVFPDAGEDFFCEERDTYRIHASKVAWEETLAHFRRCLE